MRTRVADIPRRPSKLKRQWAGKFMLNFEKLKLLYPTGVAQLTCSYNVLLKQSPYFLAYQSQRFPYFTTDPDTTHIVWGALESRILNR